jgi:tetrahydromethanopterin S-methyltransferase subunit B
MLSNHFWYGFIIGFGIVVLVVLLPVLIQRANKTAKL